MDIHWIGVDHRGVMELALATGLTTYDATYLYLARALDISLATFDQRLQQAARGVRQGPSLLGVDFHFQLENELPALTLPERSTPTP